jgi:hypothetical protein
VPLAAWFRRRGATVVLVPPERAADLRAYYAKHTKSDRLDSTVLARLPLLHPEGLHPEHGLGPGDPLRRATKLHSTLTHHRSTALARLDALLEILDPAWHAALSADLANKTPLKLLAAGYADPHVLRRIGKARLARFLYRHSRGAWGEAKAEQLLAAAAETPQLFDGELDYPELADDIALEARLALALTAEITELDERIALLVHRADPHGVISSAPGVGPITSAVILGRLGNPSRFASLAAAHSYTGLVPSLHASGLTGQHGGPTKRGDALLREALFMAANQARRLDPTLAAKYHRLIAHPGKHHTSALCHIAATLSPASWPAGAPASAISFVTPTAPHHLRPGPRDHRPALSHSRGPARHPAARAPGRGRRNKKSPSAPSPARQQPTLRPGRLDTGYELNGACYRSHAFAASLGTATHKWTRPYRPQTNGKVCEDLARRCTGPA